MTNEQKSKIRKSFGKFAHQSSSLSRPAISEDQLMNFALDVGAKKLVKKIEDKISKNKKGTTSSSAPCIDSQSLENYLKDL